MDLHHTGFEKQELIYIETDKISLTIRGKLKYNNSENIFSEFKIYKEFAYFNSINEFKIEIKGIKIESNKSLDEIYKIVPLFYEHQDYEIIIEKKGDLNLEFWHENINIRNKINPIGHSKKILSGVINFANEIGFTNVLINIDNKSYIRFEFEIFPSKISYRDDYINIIRDITDEVHNLAFDFIKKTYLKSTTYDKFKSSPSEFFAIIKTIYDEFINAIDIILNKSNYILETHKKILPAHKLKSVNNKTIRWLESHPYELRLDNIGFTANRALTSNKQISNDTLENRFVKYILNLILQKLKKIRINYINLNRNKDNDIIYKIDIMIIGIHKRLSSSFFRTIGEPIFNNMSLIFFMSAGYTEIYKYYLILSKSLSLDGDIFKISVKDLALLYEYWCFIKLNSIMKNKYKLISQNIIQTNKNDLFVTLKKGANSKTVYENPATGEIIELFYNPSIYNLPTVSQRPDIILSIHKRNSYIKYNYIFDAKYRINQANEGSAYKQNYLKPGPEEEDINTMHRYRDALVSENNSYFNQKILGAYILFPYSREKEYEEHKFYKSIGKINIGGLPFLPTSTFLVESLLDKLIS